MISNKDMYFVSQAVNAASNSEMKSKHGASLVISGKYMGSAENSFLSGKGDDWSIHAEMNVLKRCQLKGMQQDKKCNTIYSKIKF
tara:strand:- start:419 stop:673 length:255 start_codon:yes stop_codon:yes gene_type:complete